jgi:hypothetical protein
MLEITDYNTTHGIPLDLDESIAERAEEPTSIAKSDSELHQPSIEFAEPHDEAKPLDGGRRQTMPQLARTNIRSACTKF